MTEPDFGQGPKSKKPLDPGRFPRTARFIEDPAAELALREFAAAIPWARDPGYRGIRADDELYLKSIADWTELILLAHERGQPYFSLSTAFDVAVMDGISPSSLALDELIRCNRPEGVRYRLLLQETTTMATGRPSGSTLFAKTGWYDDGRAQTWAFVFWRGRPKPNTRVMSRKVTEHHDHTELAPNVTPVGDFALWSGDTKSP